MKAIPCPVSARELSCLYEDEKLTDQEIVDHLGSGATLKRVRSWRRRYGIATISRALRNRVLPIEGALKSLLVGSMLGDGRLSKAVTPRFSENHSVKQLAYLEWKVEQWGPWASPSGIKPVVWKRHGKQYEGFRFSTVSHPALHQWHDLFYPEPGPKQLMPEVIGLVNAFAFTIWYMDDGTAAWWPTITFGMDLGSRAIALGIFVKFGFRPRWCQRDGLTGDFIFEGEEQAERFIALVKPYIPECMRYKLTFGFQGRYYQIRKLSPEVALRSMAMEAVPIQQMAKRLGLSSSVVSRRLVRLGIKHPRTIGRPPARRCMSALAP